MTDTRPPQIVQGDCLEIMRMLPDNSIDAIVTDPPYGLGFMGKAWDALPPGLKWAEECLRVLKPGGHILAFGGTRTWHRLAVAIEDAGFEIRDSLYWHYGSGFPKSHDVSKGIDKAAGHSRSSDYVPNNGNAVFGSGMGGGRTTTTEPPATPAAKQWQGWGTALKPATEIIVMARKPFRGTVAQNVQEWGTGAINVDGSRVDAAGEKLTGSGKPPLSHGGMNSRPFHDGHVATPTVQNPAGRWPANVILDEHTAAIMDGQSGVLGAGNRPRVRNSDENRTAFGAFAGQTGLTEQRMDSGGASRFFKVIEPDAPFMYMAKAPKKERPVVDGVAHPTVKPVALMRWLVKLVTPPGGTVLEPFAGSGTTVEACILEGFHCIAIEREAEYLPLIQARIDRQAAA